MTIFQRIRAWFRSVFVNERHSCVEKIERDPNTGDIFCAVCGRDLT